MDWGRAQILTFLLIDQLFGDVSTTNSVGVLIAHMLVYYCVIKYDDDDDDFSLFQVRLLDNYKDRSPGLHMRTLPLLGPTFAPPSTTKT